MDFLLFFIIPLVFGLWAQHSVKSTFNRYAEVPSTSGRSGAEVARAILDRHGLADVPVHAVPGELTDHYDPRNRSVNLSESVYGSGSVAAVSVAAHEVGHAIQHATRYAPLTFRSAFFPIAALGTNASSIFIGIGAVLLFMTGTPLGYYAILAGVLFYSAAVLFQVVTLPVEFDASRRAKAELSGMGLVTAAEAGGASKVLRAAAMTYVAAALAAIAQLLYWIMILASSRD